MKVLLGVTGGIAAYKACELVRRLREEGDEVTVVMTEAAQRFVAPLTFATLSGRPVGTSLFDETTEEIDHIRFGARVADIGGEACVARIQAGEPEHEVALASTQAMVRAIADRFEFAELMDTWTWFQSGVNTDGAHNPVTNRVIRPGDILSLNCFPMMFGYYTALERTLFCDVMVSEQAIDKMQAFVDGDGDIRRG